MVAHNAQHVLTVFGKAGEGAKFLGHFSRGGIGNTGHDGRDGSANGAAFMAVIGNARGHEQTADIGKAQAERAVFIMTAWQFPSKGIAPSTPRFPKRWSTSERHVHRIRYRMNHRHA